MTTITILKTKDGGYSGFDLNGHAGFDDYGRDIVCAAVSALAINTVNSVELLTKDRIWASQDAEKGMLSFRFEEAPTEAGTLLIRSFEIGVGGIYQQYGKEFLQVEVKEA